MDNQYYILTPAGEKVKLAVNNVNCDTNYAVGTCGLSAYAFDVCDTQKQDIGKFGGYINKNNYITRVIVNEPAVVVFWNDGTKTVVKCGEKDHFDAEKGVLLAVLKRIQGKSWVAKLLQDWCPNECEWYDITLSDVRRGYRQQK